MALVHKMLYKTNDLSRINLKEYILNIMEHLMSGYNIHQNQIVFVPDLVDVWVLIDAAIPCGLILNELISNVLKHAFPHNKKGEITIKLVRVKNEEIEIHVSDNGVGLPSKFNIEKSNSLGLQNILSLGRHQLSGSVECSSVNGVKWVLKFSDNIYRERV